MVWSYPVEINATCKQGKHKKNLVERFACYVQYENFYYRRSLGKHANTTEYMDLYVIQTDQK